MKPVVRHYALVMHDISEQIAFRMTEADREIMAKLMNKLGLNYTAIIRLALRRLAEAEGMISNAAD